MAKISGVTVWRWLSQDAIRPWRYRSGIHLPAHASWLNQIEIYFSIVQRKVLTPNDFSCLEEVGCRLLHFQRHYEQIAKPFQWRFTREDLSRLLLRLSEKREPNFCAHEMSKNT